ncbi:MAG: type II toxin-antitoxin system HicA family toxin [Chromatiales bacterium]|jgi:predicted RNA binding protein YcfA (HicA-like mRNA interferase family)|nr:type II toxin-antitoxin system HicA family toxin [Chromatiales bacterium]
MTRREKLLTKAIDNPAGLSFRELEALLEQYGWVFRRQSGSHRIWKSPGGAIVPIQPANGGAKEYQVKQILRMLENRDDS